MDRLLFRARALILSDLDLNISFWARKVTRAFEKRAHGPVSRANVDKFHVRGLYKPIFTSHESQLLIKQAKKQNTVIIDTPIRILFDDRIFSLLLLSLECRWGDLKGCR